MAHPDISTRALDAESALRTVAAWLAHWRVDAASNLAPTPESVADLATLVDAVLTRNEATAPQIDVWARSYRAQRAVIPIAAA